MDLRQLRYFSAIADLGSFTEAAARLRIAQSALSRNVHTLEKELGVRLFERHARGVVLSTSGQLLLKHAKIVLSQIEQAHAEVTAERRVLAGEVSIGTWASMGQLIYGRLAESFLAAFPHVTLKLREGQPYILLEGLETGWIDLAIMVNPEPARNLQHETLVTEPLYLVGARGNRKMPKEVKGMEDVRGLPLIMLHRPNGSRTLFDNAASDAGFSLNVQHEVASIAVLKDLISRGLGFGLLPHSSVRDQMLSGVLVALPLPGLMLTRTLVRRVRQSTSPAVGELARHVHLIFEDLRRRGHFGTQDPGDAKGNAKNPTRAARQRGISK